MFLVLPEMPYILKYPQIKTVKSGLLSSDQFFKNRSEIILISNLSNLYLSIYFSSSPFFLKGRRKHAIS